MATPMPDAPKLDWVSSGMRASISRQVAGAQAEQQKDRISTRSGRFLCLCIQAAQVN